MTRRRLLLLLAFGRNEMKMASVRWNRFRKRLAGGPFDLEWAPVKLPYCEDSACRARKAIREFQVLGYARRCAGQLARNHHHGLETTVVASIPTLDPLYVGAFLKRARPANTQLVLEIRDVYARPEAFEYTAVRRRLEVFKESLLIRHVDRFIFLTDEIRRRYIEYYPSLSNIGDGIVITNGYDPEEYGPMRVSASRPDVLDIGYFGSFYGSRNPELLFQALARGDGVPTEKPSVRVHIWGETGSYPLRAKIAEYGLQRIVLYHGVASHEQVVRLCADSGVNLVITHTSGSSYALPGKLFEYIGAARPIWVITDDRILRDFITRHKLGYLSTHDVRSIAETLRTIVRDHAGAGRLPDIDRPADFEIGALTRRLERFLMDGEHARI